MSSERQEYERLRKQRNKECTNEAIRVTAVNLGAAAAVLGALHFPLQKYGTNASSIIPPHLKHADFSLINVCFPFISAFGNSCSFCVFVFVSVVILHSAFLFGASMAISLDGLLR
jgi:hypothetical protein